MPILPRDMGTTESLSGLRILSRSLAISVAERRQRLISPLPASGAERGKTCSPLGIIVKWQRGGEGSVVKLAAQFRGVWSENPVDCEPAEVMQGATAGVTQRRLFLGG
jgi:hypothetical protein